MILIGELCLWMAPLMSAWAAGVSFAGARMGRSDMIESGARAVYATLALLVLAAAGLWVALFSHDFSVEYVAAFSTTNLPPAYVFSAMWAGPAGALLLWSALSAGCSWIAVATGRHVDSASAPFVTGTLAVALLSFAGVVVVGADPFARLDWLPPDGRGMHPRFQTLVMLVQPPAAYLANATTLIPFALAAGHMAAQKGTMEWIAPARRWMHASWVACTIAILLGMWWAYVDPVRTVAWTWHPVDSGSLVPWLGASAFLYLSGRGATGRPRAAAVVAMLTFAAALFVTFVMHGGVLAGVEAFVPSPAATGYTGVLVVLAVACAWLLRSRAGILREAATGVALPQRAAQGRYARAMVLAGLVVLLTALGGTAFRVNHTLLLGGGESRQVSDAFGNRWTFVSQGISRYSALNRRITAAALAASRDGTRASVITSEHRLHVDGRGVPAFAASVSAGIRSSWLQDIYVVFAGADDDEMAELRVSFNPLVRLVWVGGAMMILGGLIAAVPLRLTSDG